MRRLIICCDGTWNRADWEGGTATNVIRIARAIKSVGISRDTAKSEIPQIVYYHAGVGTGNRQDRILGGALGLGLSKNVRDTYAFLVNNYAPGDEIFLFGFSRGAFTARTLGGMIGSIGLLRKEQMGAFLDAWAYHRLPTAERNKRKVDFDTHFPGRQTDVQIRCIGVWDTVGALGIPENRLTGRWQPCKSEYRFHDTRLGPHVSFAFQALAIDEKRHPFVPVIWTHGTDAPPSQVLKQMWFSGVHSDIGGGYKDHGSSDVALLWIASELIERGLLDIDETQLKAELDRRQPYGDGALHNSFSTLYGLFTGKYQRAISAAPGEFVHATVAQRIARGGYKSADFLERHAGRIHQLSEFERRMADYRPEAFTVRAPFMEEHKSLCDVLVQWLTN